MGDNKYHEMIGRCTSHMTGGTSYSREQPSALQASETLRCPFSIGLTGEGP